MVQGHDPIAAARARVGQTLCGKWTLDRIIDVGGMGAVYAATHRNGKRVAIKMLHASASSEPELRSRFLREGYIANKVDHPGAVSILDDDVAEDGSAFLVMELLVGESLEARLARNGNLLPAWDVLPIAERALDVLGAAHDAGVLHRDIKPGNLFVTSAGEVKILDFGLARARELSFAGSVTRTGMVMGTASYMPPEQARARWNLVDARSDLWAVGATIFRSLSGRFVHLGETSNERFVAAMTQQARSLRAVLPDAPASLVRLVDTALAFQRDDRWPDARAMQSALRDCYPDILPEQPEPDVSPGRETAPTEPEISRPARDDLDDEVPVSVVFEPSLSRPDEIMVEIADGRGRRETYELQTDSSAVGIDDLLGMASATVVSGPGAQKPPAKPK